MPTKTCVCGADFPLPEGQVDVTCAKCNRTYNYQGKFLWAENKKGEIKPGGTGVRAEDLQTDPAKEADVFALENAFVAAKLPEHDRRTQIENVIAADKAHRAKQKSKE